MCGNFLNLDTFVCFCIQAGFPPAINRVVLNINYHSSVPGVVTAWFIVTEYIAPSAGSTLGCAAIDMSRLFISTGGGSIM